ncbi:hypothetical protein TUM19329_07660 [Legionella antarctica]|uniref:Uncharacterized protein n=1 Tax=Legionella antarctica TaxID=2708020 RepID=A0A6F8T172_9GAMM|nr:hypothetical protein [Legionella antarctica]BCA94405.1 hypothetical protein TUM19329_07660 [Legionella antarctica]
MNIDILRAMERYQKSRERITKTNEVFASLVEKYCDKDTLPIFIGGAAHPITLYQDKEVYDFGLQGRVENSVSICLLEAAESSFQSKAPYNHAERNLQGTYDYQIITNKKTLYKDTFENLPQLMDKIQFLTNSLDHLIKGHLWFALNKTNFMPEEANAILLAFQESIGETIKFSSFEKLLDELIMAKSFKVPNPSLFSSKTSKELLYTREMSITAIYHDLAVVLKEEIVKKISLTNS